MVTGVQTCALPIFVDYYPPFCGPEAISIVVEAQCVFTSWSSTLAVLANSGPFVGYYSPFWGPIAISTVDDSRGAFTCPSSTLTILADFGPFRELLLTVLGSRTDFHD